MAAASPAATRASRCAMLGIDITRAGFEWKLNPLLSWSAFYEGNWYDSVAAASDYDEQRLMTSIILKR